MREKLFVSHSAKALKNSQSKLQILFIVLLVWNDAGHTAGVRLYTANNNIFLFVFYRASSL